MAQDGEHSRSTALVSACMLWAGRAPLCTGVLSHGTMHIFISEGAPAVRKVNFCYQGLFYALVSTLFFFAGGAVAGMVSKASFLHGVDFCSCNNK